MNTTGPGRKQRRVAVIGAGWAGCAAAVEATRLGHHVTLFEAARTAGGRARRVASPTSSAHRPESPAGTLDNGQHILIGAYADTLKLMTDVGVDLDATLLRLPLTLQYMTDQGLRGLKLPQLPAPLDALVGIAQAAGWSWRDKASLLRGAAHWQWAGFVCPPLQSVADLCRSMTPRIKAELIEPLCVSALNTPAADASGQVFLRVLKDSMFSGRGGSNLLLPRVDLTALLPEAAIAWLEKAGAAVALGTRVQHLASNSAAGGWQLTAAGATLPFDCVVLACAPQAAVRLLTDSTPPDGPAPPWQAWLATARALQFEAITTVYAQAPSIRLPQPMLALPSGAHAPAQFVFDRGQLGGPPGLLAFVVSASTGSSADITAQVLAQGARQLGLDDLKPVQTVVEKRATFACTPGLARPGRHVLPGLMACGDYVQGPYPATLEGAVRSGLAAARAI